MHAICAVAAALLLALPVPGASPFSVSVTTADTTQSSAIALACTVTNTSGQAVTLLWDTPRVQLAKGAVYVFTDGWGGKSQKRVRLAPKESQRFTVSIAPGDQIPALDEGEYQIVVQAAVAEDIPGRHARATATLAVSVGKGKKAVTAAAVVAVAKGFCETQPGPKPADYQRYWVRRHLTEWDVEFGVGTGSVVVSVDAEAKKAYVRPVP